MLIYIYMTNMLSTKKKYINKDSSMHIMHIKYKSTYT
jgi:hypothetical protein